MNTISRAPALSPLTEREREAVVLAGRGWTYETIAKEMSVSWDTIKNHLQNARTKLRMHTTAEAYVELGRLEGACPSCGTSW